MHSATLLEVSSSSVEVTETTVCTAQGVVECRCLGLKLQGASKVLRGVGKVLLLERDLPQPLKSRGGRGIELESSLVQRSRFL